MFAVTNSEAEEAQRLFLETEGVDIYSASGVATYSLMQAVRDGQVQKDDVVMLNITGGGEKHFKQERQVWNLEPSLVFPIDADPKAVLEDVANLF